ncbi:copper resistance CopC family protein [Frigoribacterium sp. UYMn621]|jgi:methionine-rich copper-binding protein CopC|uniref:copper resistance CopC family protein n=1 Tax=Frigoribacterium sp. UYMn621 TaxID=3156343 RepID=UPI0033997E8E
MARRSRLPLVMLVALAAMLGAAVPVVGAVTPAQAHNYLVSSTPKAGETLTALPKDFVITTNDILLNIDGNGAGFGLQVTDSAGKYYGDGCVSVEGPEMSTAASLGAAGTYTVTWQAVSTDGHTVSDSYGFTWQPPVGFTPSPGAAAVPDCNGTASVNTKPAAGSGTTGAATVDTGTLSTVLWVGGAFLAVAAAVIVTLVATGRKSTGRQKEPSA